MSRAPNSGLVRPSFVFAGEHWVRPAAFEIGIWTLATLELSGPMTATTFGFDTRLVMFCAPVCGSWTPSFASSRTSTPTAANAPTLPYFMHSPPRTLIDRVAPDDVGRRSLHLRPDQASRPRTRR